MGFTKISHGANAQLGEEGQGSSNEILQGLAKQGHLQNNPIPISMIEMRFTFFRE
jgi:hypothetical protein